MLAFLTVFFWLRSKSFYEGITPSKINQVHVSNGIFVDIQISWRLLNCSAWLRSIPFNSFTKFCGLRVPPMTFFFVNSKCCACFWVHGMYSTLHCMVLRCVTLRSSLSGGMQPHGRRWNPAGCTQRGVWTHGKRGNESNWVILGTLKQVRHDNHGSAKNFRGTYGSRMEV